ncbi:MAG TPA: DUF11 domain-containing protein [Longimicrobiaceae bacterium]|nr:DUF11 domain-containing protein [Longimicrobiaceae bacterium]
MSARAPRTFAAWVALALSLCAANGAHGMPAGRGMPAAEPGAPAPPAVSVAMVSAPDLTLDSNRPCTGPQATYVAFRVTNTSGAPQTDLRATLGGFAGGITLAGGQAATQYVGALAPGAQRNVYWLVTYPCSFGVSATLTASVTDASAGAATGSGTVTTRSMISAQAGGVLVSGLLGPGAVVGQTIPLDVTYDFGGADVGTTYDLQPVGNTSFSAGCFQMVGSLVTSSNILAIPAGAANRQYFTASAKQTGNGQQATIRYYFKYLCAGVASSARPYSNQLSGTQLKYSSNYETFVGPTLPGASNPFTVSKSVSPAVLDGGGSVTYTVTVSNPSPFTAEVDSLVDALPQGVTYTGTVAGSGVSAASSGWAPTAPSAGTLTWRGPYTLPAGGTLTLVYTADVAATPGQYVNSAAAWAGLTHLGTATATVTVASYGVAVSPQGLPSAERRLAGTAYARPFTVTNTSSVAETFDLAVRLAGAAGTWATVDSLTGPGIATGARPDSARVSLAAGGSGDFTVWYTVAAGPLADDVLHLRARSVARPAVQAEGWAELRRVLPALTLARSVLPSASSPPGTDLTYTLQFGNGGEADASGVVVTDLLPAQLLFKLGSLQETLPAGVSATVAFSADGGASWSYVPASGECSAPAGYDACVQRIRWTLAGTLPADPALSAGSFRFVARIR